eukprot:Hpha_TRINITY_DN16794_c6_g2::TRINITY_DN16794_c6_g2_i1::g.78938::m.78938
MLCGKSWGLRRQAVRGLYLGYIQAAVDYCLAVYGRGDTKELKEAHLAAAELITGAAVASRHALILQEAELLPFDARVDSATALLVERAKHLLPGTPLRSVLEEAHDLAWVKKAEQSIEAAGVSGLREEIVNAPLAPWKFDLPITFASDVHGEVSKSDPPEVKKAASLRTLEALPQADWFIYTDGSAVDGVTKGGAGVILIHGATKRSWTFSRAAGSLCSSYRAEVCAFRCALEELRRILRETDLGGGVIRICTDSRAAICRLERGAALQRDKAGQQVWELLATLCEEFPGASVHVQFVYSHCGVERGRGCGLQTPAGRRRDRPPDRPRGVEALRPPRCGAAGAEGPAEEPLVARRRGLLVFAADLPEFVRNGEVRPDLRVFLFADDLTILVTHPNSREGLRQAAQGALDRLAAWSDTNDLPMSLEPGKSCW